MTLDHDAIANLLQPVLIYFATPEYPDVRLTLSVCPKDGDDTCHVFEGVGRLKFNVIAVATKETMLNALATAVEMMLPDEATRARFELLVWSEGRDQPHRITGRARQDGGYED